MDSCPLNKFTPFLRLTIKTIACYAEFRKANTVLRRTSNVSDAKYWLGFSLVPEIGPKRIAQLMNHFGDLGRAWHATESQLLQAELDKHPTVNLLHTRTRLDLDSEMAKVKKAGAWLLTLMDEHYPSQLKQLADAPAVLYVRGVITTNDDFALSIVGTRNATKYGRDAAYDLAKQIARHNITIVSGLAHGVDAAAHRGALDGGGRTFAVLGCGVDIIYPRENHDLALKIMQNGALISEFPVGIPPDGRNFPRRNRVISGLAHGVLVVEAPEGSGAMITAEAALEQGRDVFAVPGNIFSPMSRGTNRLIQEGAKLVMDANDVLDELNFAHKNVQTRTKTERIVPANETEARLLQHLSADPIHIDDLVRLSQLPISVVTGTLTILELKGLAQPVGNMQYCLSRH
jgi:DNA processing protein